jgi:hypothetical protein
VVNDSLGVIGVVVVGKPLGADASQVVAVALAGPANVLVRGDLSAEDVVDVLFGGVERVIHTAA